MDEKSIQLNSVPIPPKDAEEFSTVCDYCVVGCAYKVYRWPVGKKGGPRSFQNALRANFPVPKLSGKWISEQMHSKIFYRGKEHHVVVLPDPDTQCVNLHGDHSIRGGALAQKLYHPDRPTRDRLQKPMVRVGGELLPLEWEQAIELFSRLTRYAVENFGPSSWAQKRYSYQFFENTYALSKLAWQVVESPAYADHDNPGRYPATPGLKDCGIEPFSASYEDYYLAQRIFVSGSDPYETKTALFNEWMLRGVRDKGNTLIYVNPRKTMGASFAVKNGGLHLPILPGTDTLLHLSLSRIILENQWEDEDFITEFTSRKVDHGYRRYRGKAPARWNKNFDEFLCEDFSEFKNWILNTPDSKLDFVSRQTGLEKEQIFETARLLAQPFKDGKRPKSSFFFEKGLYWSNNYLNTASLVSLALLCGAGNRPGQMVSRMGGHQRGNASVSFSPYRHSPINPVTPHRRSMNLDEWFQEGKVRFAWVIGTNWINAMAASSNLHSVFQEKTIQNPNQPTSTDLEHLVEVFSKRMKSGGTFLVEQNIYLTRKLGQLADLVLPAATWGEENFTRANGERRIRLYSKFMDPPGEALPDWKIAARIAQKLGASGFGWKDSNEVFEEASAASRGGVLSYENLVSYAQRRGVRSHDLLSEMGSNGIQAPVRIENGRLEGTKRLHNPEFFKGMFYREKGLKIKSLNSFSTSHGRANFLKAPWEFFEDFYTHIKPVDQEFWVINGRINEIWQSGFDDLLRREVISNRWPAQFLEIHPHDARRLGIESGDQVLITNTRVPLQIPGSKELTLEDQRFAQLKKRGEIRHGFAQVRAVALVQPVPRPSVTFLYALHPDEMANNLVSNIVDPISGNYRYKLGFGIIEKIGVSPYKEDLSKMSFVSRNLEG